MAAADPAIFIPRTRPVKPSIVGGFMLSGLALVIVAILVFGHIDLFNSTERAVVIFPNPISGLVVGAPVAFRGVEVGSVRSIAIDLDGKDMTARVYVTLDLNRDALRMAGDALPGDHADLERLLRAGLVAQLDSSSLITGRLQVELDLRPDLKTVSTWTDRGLPEIPAIASPFELIKTQIEQLQLRQLVDTAQRTLESIQRVSDQLGNRVGPLVDSVQSTSDAARDTVHIASDAIRSLEAESTRTMGDFDKLAIEGQQQLSGRGAELSHVLADGDHTVHEVKYAVRFAKRHDIAAVPDARRF